MSIERLENNMAGSTMQKREAAAIAAEEAAGEDFLTAFENFVRQFVTDVPAGTTFTAESVQMAYRDRLDLPQPDEWRATGMLWRRLAKERVVVPTGRTVRSPTRGNPMTEYMTPVFYELSDDPIVRDAELEAIERLRNRRTCPGCEACMFEGDGSCDNAIENEDSAILLRRCVVDFDESITLVHGDRLELVDDGTARLFRDDVCIWERAYCIEFSSD